MRPVQREPISKWKAVLLSWLAFAVTCCLVFGLILLWPWLRGASAEQAARVHVSIGGALFFTAVAVGLSVRDYVQRRLGIKTGKQDSKVAGTGCLFVAVPASVIAFFCTCAPLGLLAGAEGSVRPAERSWSSEMMIAAWVVGVISALVVARGKHQGDGNE